MSLFVTPLIALLAAFFAAMLLAPPFLALSKRAGASQKLLDYVTQHSEKKDVPTAGGVVFLTSTIGIALAFGGYASDLCLMLMIIFFAYGVIGFLDDMIKIKLNRNLGLRAYQKIISQVVIAVAFAFYCARSPYVGTVIALPFTDAVWDLGNWYVPFAVFLFIAMSNAVNLTDGLDGLAGTTTSVCMTTFLVIIGVLLFEATAAGNTLYAAEYKGMSLFAAALIGSLLGFLWYNSHKAKVFMGDTGSLALGGAVAAVALFTKNPLISAFVGIMYVVSCISVIVQVISFKLTKKRVFLMSPFHHHLELKGYNESKIVAFYGIITAIAGVVSLIIM